MQAISFDQLLEATRSLPLEQRQILAEMLSLSSVPQGDDDLVAAAEVLNEAGAYSVADPLVEDAHVQPARISDAELMAAAQCISCEWEEELQ